MSCFYQGLLNSSFLGKIKKKVASAVELYEARLSEQQDNEDDPPNPQVKPTLVFILLAYEFLVRHIMITCCGLFSSSGRKHVFLMDICVFRIHFSKFSTRSLTFHWISPAQCSSKSKLCMDIRHSLSTRKYASSPFFIFRSQKPPNCYVGCRLGWTRNACTNQAYTFQHWPHTCSLRS